MNKKMQIILVVIGLLAIAAFGIRQTIKTLEQSAQAYIFGYPAVLLDLTRQSMTNPKTGRAPVNHFSHIMGFPDHNYRQIVRPNNDTLYSVAWLDLTSEPLVLSVPDMDGRYYVMPFMDAWSNVFDSVGSRKTGDRAGDYLIAGPDWKTDKATGLKTIRSPTNSVWLLGRIQTNGRKDFPNVFKLQHRFLLTPFSRWRTGQPNPGFFISDYDPDTIKSDNPSAEVWQMSALEFFSYLSRVMALQPPAEADAPAVKMLEVLGIVSDKPFNAESIGFFRQLLLEKGVNLARSKLEDAQNRDRSLYSENNWIVARDGIGTYGTNYEVRAFVNMIGLGALTPAEAAYPNCYKDQNGETLSGQHQYRIHFDADRLPPAKAFWSLTVYDEKGFLVDNPIHRYTIGNRDDLKYNADGSLDILIQHRQPPGCTNNWLPTPGDNFAVTMRLYWPEKSFLSGEWKVPFVEKTASLMN